MDFVAFVVKALFSWNECLRNAEISILSDMVTFSKFFSMSRNVGKYQVSYTCQVSNQLDYSIKQKLRNVNGQLNLPSPSCTNLKMPCLFRVYISFQSFISILSESFSFLLLEIDSLTAFQFLKVAYFPRLAFAHKILFDSFSSELSIHFAAFLCISISFWFTILPLSIVTAFT